MARSLLLLFWPLILWRSTLHVSWCRVAPGRAFVGAGRGIAFGAAHRRLGLKEARLRFSAATGRFGIRIEHQHGAAAGPGVRPTSTVRAVLTEPL
ncbi:MAG: hypothetical protein P8R46_10740 [Planctomycetota bacterium]|nr:hypothetical protein [Planctomycetota bacterium]